MNKKDKPQNNSGNKNVDKVNKNDVNLDKLDMDGQNTKGDDKMENVIKREDQYSETNIYKKADDKKVNVCIKKYTKKYNKALRNLAK